MHTWRQQHYMFQVCIEFATGWPIIDPVMLSDQHFSNWRYQWFFCLIADNINRLFDFGSVAVSPHTASGLWSLQGDCCWLNPTSSGRLHTKGQLEGATELETNSVLLTQAWLRTCFWWMQMKELLMYSCCFCKRQKNMSSHCCHCSYCHCLATWRETWLITWLINIRKDAMNSLSTGTCSLLGQGWE